MENEIREKMNRAGQEHVFRFWSDLKENDRDVLLKQLEQVDGDQLAGFQNRIKTGDDAEHYTPGTLEPVEVIPLPDDERGSSDYQEASQAGEALLSEGRVGIILVAGGQGTRLGYDGPKGFFPVGPVTDRTLFEIHLEKILALEKRYGCTLPLYIMTSESNHRTTVEGFKRFAAKPSSITFFQQGMLPTLDRHGKLILEEKGRLSRAPDGHGGLLTAMKRNRVLENMMSRDLQVIFYFQVDNVLTKICDPIFLGLHHLRGAEMSAKTVYKRDAGEKLGSIGRIGGRVVTIEYTELSDEEKEMRRDGRLKFGQGSIAIHAFSVSFLHRLIAGNNELPFHIAFKKIAAIDELGEPVRPETPNGYKFEQFIFDAFPHARSVMVMETRREQDFSPIKNKSGPDSPERARQDLCNIYGLWLERCGYTVNRDEAEDVIERIEISSLYAMDDKELCDRLPQDFVLTNPTLLA